MKHKHHIIPKHMGGTDVAENLIELTVEEHAEAHRLLFEKYGLWQDEVAWKGLAGIIGKEEIIKRVQSEAAKERIVNKGNPFSGIRIGKNFAIDPEHRKMASNLANSETARKKRKETFAKMQHQVGSKNSNYGNVWCVKIEAENYEERKLYKPNEIPDGWISCKEHKDRRKKKTKTYGYGWYNDGRKNYYLKADDSKIEEFGLEKRRIL